MYSAAKLSIGLVLLAGVFEIINARSPPTIYPVPPTPTRGKTTISHRRTLAPTHRPVPTVAPEAHILEKRQVPEEVEAPTSQNEGNSGEYVADNSGQYQEDLSGQYNSDDIIKGVWQPDDSGAYQDDHSWQYVPDSSGIYMPDVSGQYLPDTRGLYVEGVVPPGSVNIKTREPK